MATESLQIVISERGGQEVVRRINRIGQAGGSAAHQVNILNQALMFKSTRIIQNFTTINNNFRALQRNADNARRSVGFLTRAFQVLLAAQASRILVKTIDSYQELSNKIRTVSASQVEAKVVMKEIIQIADRTRQSIDDVAKVYQRASAAAAILGKSQRDVLRFTETLQTGTAISGANPEEAKSAMLQFSQAFGANRLSGQELNSVLEQLPILADAIAIEMGVLTNNTDLTRFSLKELGKEGKITSEVMFNAVMRMDDVWKDKLGNTIPTIGQSLVRLKNAITAALGEFAQENQVFEKFSKLVSWVVENMDTLGRLAKLAGIAIGSVLVAKGINLAISAMSALTALIMANPLGALIVAVTAATTAVVIFSDKIKIAGSEHTTLADVGIVALRRLKNWWDDLTKSVSDSNKELGFWGRELETFKSQWRELENFFKNPPRWLQFMFPHLSIQPFVEDMKSKVANSEFMSDVDRQSVIRRQGELTDFRMQEDINARLERESKAKPPSPKPPRAGGRNKYNFNRALQELEDMRFDKQQEINTLQQPERARESAKEMAQWDAKILDIRQKLANANQKLTLQQELKLQVLRDQYLVAVNQEIAIRRQQEAQRETADEMRTALQQEREMRQQLDRIMLENSTEFSTQMTLAFMTMRDETENTAKFMAETFAGIVGPGGTLVQGFADAFASGIMHADNFAEVVGNSLANLRDQVIHQILSSIIQAGLNAILTSTITASTAAQSLQAAWYGPAYLASVATMGGAAGVGAAALSAGFASSQGTQFLVSNLAANAPIKTTGFAEGGFTGNGPRSSVAGMVHGQEFVMNANATRRIGVKNLERMNNGGSPAGAAGMKVNVHNYGGGEVEVRQISPDEIDLIVRRRIAKDVPNMVAGQINDPNSPTSKALSGNLSTTRRRT